jgi:hypothetical protein
LHRYIYLGHFDTNILTKVKKLRELYQINCFCKYLIGCHGNKANRSHPGNNSAWRSQKMKRAGSDLQLGQISCLCTNLHNLPILSP